MKITAFLGTAAASLGLMAAAGPALAAPAPAFMPLGAPAAAPPGFTDLCQRDLESCGAAQHEIAALTGQLTGPAPQPGLATSSTSTAWSGGRRLTFAAQAIALETEIAAEDEVAALTVETLQPLRLDADFALVSPVQALAAALSPTPFAAPARPAINLASAPGEPPRLSRDQMKLLNDVNRRVNREVQKAEDFDLYGMIEYWSLPRVIDGKMYGDCEDYALEKRRRLIEAGVPAAALSMAVAVTARGESHAVLVVAMEQGDWVLDNLTPWATPWSELNYRWIERQAPGSAAWVTIG
ncbi:cysteine protease [Caulobacter flavus]|uniref:Cysteine protease n=1 Tax=Caulobacter flavus TaxID=1679497 RepID=A0A2N5CR03_9CAUL|nr:transglutaminase-like cysteine peptidase [Caulobacter flavus]AYV45599.1 cysteine protease [Caulobacter flavus]PLR10639.1 cysteine protease [Caulobacter flavus]